jgi:hypothetical protein
MFTWFSYIGLENLINFLREIFYPLREKIPSWVYYSLPDALWTYSFTSSLFIRTRYDVRIIKYWILFPVFGGVISEFAQLINVIPGTYCVTDLLLSTIAIPISIFLIIKQNNNGRIYENFKSITDSNSYFCWPKYS